MTATTDLSPSQRANLARLLAAPETVKVLQAADQEAAERRAKVLNTRTDTLERLAKERKSAKLDERVAADAEKARAAAEALHAANASLYESQRARWTNDHLVEVATRDARRNLEPLGSELITATLLDLAIAQSQVRCFAYEGKMVEHQVHWTGKTETEFVEKFPAAKTSVERIAELRADVAALEFAPLSPVEILNQCNAALKEARALVAGFPEIEREDRLYVAPPASRGV